MDLKCRKLGCKYNKDFACVKKGIAVDSRTNCKSYTHDETRDTSTLQDASRDMFEVAPEVHPYRHNKRVDIDCHAKCLFNENGKCVANGITIQNKETGAACITVIDK